MEQFSHDLTLALEETSRGVARGRWGIRRRTRSTGNLPMAPQPTEDSSSPLDIPQNCPDESLLDASIQSDSDDLHSFAFAFKKQTTPMSGNFESDSLNENFSPARFCRPSARRKRKFNKRMAVEYETTPSTPHATNNPIFGGTVKKRVLKHTCQENFRSSLFFCGKRKRGHHRDRYMDYESHKHHSNQRDLFTPKASSYLEYKSRNRTSSFTTNVKCEKILPLNKSIVSKIEKISQDMQRNNIGFSFVPPIENKTVEEKSTVDPGKFLSNESMLVQKEVTLFSQTPSNVIIDGGLLSLKSIQKIARPALSGGPESSHTLKNKLKSRKSKQNRRREMRRHLQFDDQNYMDCAASMNDFLSSSSLSSSDSEAVLTNETDHEGDDELTDWPGNEVMINFTSKCDFKRINKMRAKPTLPLIKQHEDTIQDDDTLMCADDLASVSGSIEKPPETSNLPSNKLNNPTSMPIDIVGNVGYQYTKQIESEMSGETSNNFLSSPNNLPEIREFRAGCRRIREERPGFSIISSANEYLSSNTMQSVRIDSNIPKCFSDFKRRCIDTEDIEFNDMT